MGLENLKARLIPKKEYERLKIGSRITPSNSYIYMQAKVHCSFLYQIESRNDHSQNWQRKQKEQETNSSWSGFLHREKRVDP